MRDKKEVWDIYISVPLPLQAHSACLFVLCFLSELSAYFFSAEDPSASASPSSSPSPDPPRSLQICSTDCKNGINILSNSLSLSVSHHRHHPLLPLHLHLHLHLSTSLHPSSILGSPRWKRAPRLCVDNSVKQNNRKQCKICLFAIFGFLHRWINSVNQLSKMLPFTPFFTWTHIVCVPIFIRNGCKILICILHQWRILHISA